MSGWCSKYSIRRCALLPEPEAKMTIFFLAVRSKVRLCNEAANIAGLGIEASKRTQKRYGEDKLKIKQ